MAISESLDDLDIEVTKHKELASLKDIANAENIINRAVLWADEDLFKEFFPNLEYIGHGAESIVVVDPSDPDKVISIGMTGDYTHGVVPFTEMRHLHILVSTLFPEYFPHLYKVDGIARRHAVRDRVRGEPVPTSEILRISSHVTRILSQLGITNFTIDEMSTENARQKPETHQIKYVDWMMGSAKSVKDVDMDKVKHFVMDKFLISVKKIDEDERWKAIVRSVKLLKELSLVNSLFSEMVNLSENHHVPLDIALAAADGKIEGFSFLGGEEDLKARRRIHLWLMHATQAVSSHKHIFSSGHWIK